MLKSLRLFPILLAALLLTACEFTLAADITPPPGYQPEPEMISAPEATSGPLYPLLPPDPVGGVAIYIEKCAPCHGAGGMGDGPQGLQLPNPVPALGDADIARQAVPAEWFRIVTQGNLERFMPPFGSLTDRQRWDVVAYALSLSLPEGSLEQGEELYQANCLECHASDGTPARPGALDFTSQEQMAVRSTQDLYQAITAGKGEQMPGYAEQLSDDQRLALAYYLRTFTVAFHAGAAMETSPTQAVTITETLAPPAPLTDTVVITPTEGMGSISGVVINASGTLLPSGLTVTLHGFDSMQVVLTATTTTDENGAYLFSDIELLPERLYLATVDFQDITYGSDVLSVEPGQMNLEMPLQVYESTRDSAVLSVDRLHFFFEMAGEDVIRVVELYIISNPSSKTLIGAQRGEPVVSFTLPEGASNLEFQEGDISGRYILTENGFADTVPVRPGIGGYQVMFSYELPYKGKLELVRPAIMVTNAVVVLVPEDGIKIKGDTIQDAGVRDVQGSPYHLYNGSGVQAGQEIRMTISNNVTLLPSGSSTDLLVGLAALGVVMIGVGVWLYRRNQVASDDDSADEAVEDQAQAETPESVMDAILALDDLHQAGDLPEDAYIQRRAELRERLKELMDRQ